MAPGAAAPEQPPGGSGRKARSSAGGAGKRRLSKVPREEAVEQLREVAGVLGKTPQGQGAALAACVQGAAAEELVRHPDREVRLWAAKCLAEGLRIFAPEPPLEARQLRSAMELFLEQLGALADPSGAAFVHAFGLLEQLIEVCAFMLVFECEDPDVLLVKTVKVCLGAARSSEGGRLEGLLSQVLTSVLGEADSIPRPVLMELIEELAPRRQSKFAAGLVRQVLGGLASHSAVLSINEFLNATLYGQAQGVGGAEGLETASGKEADAAVFCAVYELFAIDAALVARVIPNFYADLQCEDTDRRRAVTILVGRMLAHHTLASPSTKPRVPLVSTHPLLLDRHLERLADAHEDVRLAALEGAAALLATATSFSGAVSVPGGGGGPSVTTAMAHAGVALRQKLLERCLDPSDAVRLCVVKVVADVSASVAGLELLAPILPEVFRRILDKRPRIREACASAAAELYARHALPAWTEGCGAAAEMLAWVPQLLCEAYSVYEGGHLGQTAQLEELIEQHILGCGAALQARQRALALLGFSASAAGQEGPAQGLQLLLRRKCDANAALRRYLQFRIAKAAPALDAQSALGGQALSVADGDPGRAAAGAAAAALESLGRLSPTMEDRSARPENLLVHLRALDAVRDRALWVHLDRLSHPRPADKTSDMESLLGELDRLLRVHRLSDLAPLFRRALLSTWLLPDQVPTLLEAWGHQQVSQLPFQGALHQVLVDLARCFPGAFLPHVKAVMRHLEVGSEERSRAALRLLGALGKRADSIRAALSAGGAAEAVTDVDDLPLVERSSYVDTLLRVAKTLGERQPASTCGSVCRKAVRALSLVQGAGSQEAVEQALQWAEGEGVPRAFSLHLVAACFGRPADGPEASGPDPHRSARERWQTACKQILQSEWQQLSEAHLAAADLCMALGAEADVRAVMTSAAERGVRLPLDFVASVLRAWRCGTLPLTTLLLSQVACRLGSALAEAEEDPRLDALTGALLKLQKPSRAGLRLADRLRLCTTLPAVFALAQARRPREAMGRALQASLLKATQQCTVRQEPLLDFAIACFLHFLSRLDFFRAEAAAAASACPESSKLAAYPESTKLAAFVCEALLRSDPLRSAELAGVALRVCERVRFFVDREAPTSDAVHRAAHVLRYVVERRCPELGAHGAGLQGAARGSMPAELFALAEAAAPAAAAARAPPLPAPPRALAAAGAAQPATGPAGVPPKGARGGGPSDAATPQKCPGRGRQLGRETPAATAVAGTRSSGSGPQGVPKRQRLA